MASSSAGPAVRVKLVCVDSVAIVVSNHAEGYPILNRAIQPPVVNASTVTASMATRYSLPAFQKPLVVLSARSMTTGKRRQSNWPNA